MLQFARHGVTRVLSLLFLLDAHAVVLRGDQLPRAPSELGDLSIINVVYAATPLNFPGLLYSMISVVRNSEDSSDVAIHVITDPLNMSAAEEVLRCFDGEFDAGALAGAKKPRVNLYAYRQDTRNWNNQYSYMAYARFWIHEYLEAAPRAVWIDTDTIVQKDLGPLYRMHMDYALAASLHRNDSVQNVWTWRDCLRWYSRDLVFNKFNDGVLVLDLDKWRRGNFSNQLVEVASKCRQNDQDAMNYVFLGRRDVFNKTWNMIMLGSPGSTRSKWLSPDMAVGAILHWQGPLKPWLEPERCFNNETARNSDRGCLGPTIREVFDRYKPTKHCMAFH